MWWKSVCWIKTTAVKHSHWTWPDFTCSCFRSFLLFTTLESYLRHLLMQAHLKTHHLQTFPFAPGSWCWSRENRHTKPGLQSCRSKTCHDLDSSRCSFTARDLYWSQHDCQTFTTSSKSRHILISISLYSVCLPEGLECESEISIDEWGQNRLCVWVGSYNKGYNSAC